MELRHLRYFVGVAEMLNFTRAAQQLRVAQPALSRQIRQLEDELGVQLFKRNRREVRLTPSGEIFLREARALLDRSAEAVRLTQTAHAGQTPQLNLGYVWGIFHSLVPRLLTRFRRQHRDVALHLFDLTATQQVEALQEGRLDLGFIGFADEADAARLAKQQIGSCRWVAALPRSHRAARRAQLELSSLAQEFFLVISERTYPGAARWVTRACQQAGFRPRVVQSPERGHAILGLVASGGGVALLPESLRALPHPGVVFRPLVDVPASDLFVAWNESRPSPERDAFLGVVGD
jgi:DNA-binding transcriptional LysR family regulator